MVIVISLMCVAILGCAPQPASIEPTPTKLMLTSTSEPAVMTVRVLDAKGQEIPTPQVTYAISAPEVATVDATGSVSAKASGQAVITVTAGQITAEVPVEVALYSAIKLEPTELPMSVGETKMVTAAVLNEKNEPATATVTWQTSDAAIATVAATGEVTALAAGTATITAEAATLKVSMSVTVSQAGPASLKAAKQAVELKAGKAEKVEVQALDAAGAAAQGVTIQWTTSDEKVATVSPEGEIKGVAKGTATVTAAAGAQTATIAVTIK
jgi:uncharacterized protein YjdB